MRRRLLLLLSTAALATGHAGTEQTLLDGDNTGRPLDSAMLMSTDDYRSIIIGR